MSTTRADSAAALTPDQAAPRSVAAPTGWRTEDWIATFIGAVVILAVLAAFAWKVVDLSKVTSAYRWTTDSQIAAMTPGWIAKLESVPPSAESKALKQALLNGDRKAIEAAAAKLSKVGGKSLAGALAGEIRGHAAENAATRVFTWDNLSRVFYVGIAVIILAAGGIALLGARVAPFLIGLPAVLVLAWLARFLAGNGLFVD